MQASTEGGGELPLEELVDTADPLAAVADDAYMLHRRARERWPPDVDEIDLHVQEGLWACRMCAWRRGEMAVGARAIVSVSAHVHSSMPWHDATQCAEIHRPSSCKRGIIPAFLGIVFGSELWRR